MFAIITFQITKREHREMPIYVIRTCVRTDQGVFAWPDKLEQWCVRDREQRPEPRGHGVRRPADDEQS